MTQRFCAFSCAIGFIQRMSMRFLQRADTDLAQRLNEVPGLDQVIADTIDLFTGLPSQKTIKRGDAVGDNGLASRHFGSRYDPRLMRIFALTFERGQLFTQAFDFGSTATGFYRSSRRIAVRRARGVDHR